jgi:thiol peroxidase|tara:strand:- start:256 stop:771 length:516 start_codon:yes stop_codon:yes gene_type:complete
MESIDSVTLKGSEVLLKGEIPDVGEIAPDFTVVKKDLIELSLYDIEGKNKIILALPSIDTKICAMESARFNKDLSGINNLEIIAVSKDLPFALKRYCEADGIENITSCSDFRYGDFGTEFNVEMVNGPLKGLLARAIFVLDKKNRIKYLELVPEITREPDYEAAMEAVKAL